MRTENIEFTSNGEWAANPEIRRKRLVVTGIGLITPLGTDTERTWSNIIAGKTGISSLDYGQIARDAGLEEYVDYDSKIQVAGRIDPDFDPSKQISSLGISTETFNPKKDPRRMSRAVLISLATAAQALNNAGLLDKGVLKDEVDHSRFGTKIGTSIGGMEYIAFIQKKLSKGIRPSPNSPLIAGLERVASVPSQVFQLRAEKFTVTDACATGSQSIIAACKDILLGDADLVLAGGVDTSISPITLEMFDSLRALTRSNDPRSASRPFDKNRDGFVMAEGAGMMVIESEEHALKRGANIIAEIAGYGSFSDAHHDTEPSGFAASESLRTALHKSGLPDDGILYINAHGTSTPIGDPVEITQIRKVLEGIPKRPVFAISSTKGAMGHTMGASGAIEEAIAILALRDQVLPPTCNLHEVMEEGVGIDFVPNDARKARIDKSGSGNFGFGGSGTQIINQQYHPR